MRLVGSGQGVALPPWHTRPGRLESLRQANDCKAVGASAIPRRIQVMNQVICNMVSSTFSAIDHAFVTNISRRNESSLPRFR